MTTNLKWKLHAVRHSTIRPIKSLQYKLKYILRCYYTVVTVPWIHVNLVTVVLTVKTLDGEWYGKTRACTGTDFFENSRKFDCAQINC